MPSFEFADCPTRLELAADGGGEQAGSLTCTLRNASARRQTARIRVAPLDGARAEWFALGGAPATSPIEIEQDIEAGGTLTVTVAVRVRPAAAGSHGFRLRATSEAAPDTDFAEGPAVAFTIAAPKEPAPAPKAFPWWAIAAAAVLVLIVGGAIGWLVWPRGLDAALVKGKPFAQARAIAAEHGFPDIKAVPGTAAGHDPAQQIVVDVGKDAAGATVLLVDPGVTVPDLERQDPVAAAKRLIEIGVMPSDRTQVAVRSDLADGVVAGTNPRAATQVALGGTVTIIVNNRPSGGTGPTNPCIRNLRACVDYAPVLSLQDRLSRERLLRPIQ